MKKKFEMRLNELNNKSIVSIDVESNGLWGQAFSISAIVFDSDGEEIDKFIARCPITEKINPWVAENVLPKMTDITETHENYKSMLADFFAFLKENKETVALTHMGHIVEAKLLQDAHNLGVIEDWGAPYLWYDVCLLFDDSTDNYCKDNDIELGESNTHNPVYDCLSAYKAFKHFIQK